MLVDEDFFDAGCHAWKDCLCSEAPPIWRKFVQGAHLSIWQPVGDVWIVSGTCLQRGLIVFRKTCLGRTPYVVALNRKHGACAALLNPLSAVPLIWPSLLKFISELNPEAKTLLEIALVEASREREKKVLKGTVCTLPYPLHLDDEDTVDVMSKGDDY